MYQAIRVFFKAEDNFRFALFWRTEDKSGLFLNLIRRGLTTTRPQRGAPGPRASATPDARAQKRAQKLPAGGTVFGRGSPITGVGTPQDFSTNR